MPVYMVDNIGDKSFAKQAWFDWLGLGSRLFGDLRLLDLDFRVRGKRRRVSV